MAKKPAAPRSCSVEGCTGKHAARGLCKNHYVKAIRDGELDKFPTERKANRIIKRMRKSRVAVFAKQAEKSQAKGTQGAVYAALQVVAMKLFFSGHDEAAAVVRTLAREIDDAG